MTVSLAQATLNALCTYLQTALTNDITVRSRWPSPTTPAAAKAVTILQAGTVDSQLCGNQVLASTLVGGGSVSATWAVYQCSMPFRIDIWAKTDIARDDIRAQLQNALNKGTSVISQNADPGAEGLVLNYNAADGYSGTIDYISDDATLIDQAEAYQRSEYRATIRGEARFVQVETVTSPRLLNIKLSDKVHEAPLGTSSMVNDQTIVTETGTTRIPGG